MISGALQNKTGIEKRVLPINLNYGNKIELKSKTIM